MPGVRMLVVLLCLAVFLIPGAGYAQESDPIYSDETWTAELPTGWIVDERATGDDELHLFSSPDAQEAEVPGPGMAGLVVVAYDEAALNNLGTSALDAPQAVLTTFSAVVVPPGNLPALSEAETLALARPIARAQGGDEQATVTVYALRLAPRYYGVAVLTTAPGEAATFQADIESLLVGLQFHPELDAEYEYEDEETGEALTVAYPEGWRIAESDGLQVIVESHPQGAGRVMVAVQFVPTGIDSDLETIATALSESLSGEEIAAQTDLEPLENGRIILAYGGPAGTSVWLEHWIPAWLAGIEYDPPQPEPTETPEPEVEATATPEPTPTPEAADEAPEAAPAAEEEDEPLSVITILVGGLVGVLLGVLLVSLYVNNAARKRDSEPADDEMDDRML